MTANQPMNEAQRIEAQIKAIIQAAVDEIETLKPLCDGDAMALLDARGVNYDDIMQAPDEDQSILLEKRALQEFARIAESASYLFAPLTQFGIQPRKDR